MTAVLLGPRGPIGPLANGGFEVSYVPDDGAEHRVPITQAAWAVPLEHGSPVRRFTSRKGQRHLRIVVVSHYRRPCGVAGKPDPHAPDFFARRSDSSAVVVDCRPVERRRPRDVAKFEATADRL